jgi:glycosyltransferase involved in cell wall biosynthesis
MNIAINARVLTERPGGPMRYTRNIIRELAKIDRKNQYFLIINQKIPFDIRLPDNFHIILLKSRNRLFFEYVLYPWYSWRHRIDIHLFPKNTFAPFVRGMKIPVYHDIIYYERDLGFREFKFLDHIHHLIMVRVSSWFSTIDLTVSNFTAERMVKLLRINPAKIRIIGEGAEPVFRLIKDRKYLADIRKRFDLKEPFFFYSGSLSPRKNVLRVIKAFEKIMDKIPHRIYFTASDSWNDIIVFNRIDENKLGARVIQLGYLTDEELAAMYCLSQCYLYPSLYEGFGLPIIEAQSCGTPVITSNITSCPEIAGESALLVNPYDISQIADAMLKISKSPSLRKSLIQKGAKNVRNYSWKRTARELLALFDELKEMQNKR